MSKKLLFNLNKNVSQDYTYVKYTGTIVTATNTLEKPIKNAILKGDTKYRDVDTGEILDSFDGTKNLELVSVKMPVLTTIGKNLFFGEVINNKDINGNTGLVGNGNRTISVNFIPVKPNTTYTFTRPVSNGNIGIRYYSKNQNYLSTKAFIGSGGRFNVTFTTPNNCCFIKFIDEANTLNSNYQIEEGSTATSYEPYKTNILTVNEELSLKAVDDVKDELNCLTGEVVEHINEIMFDGSSDENWVIHTEYTDSIVFRLTLTKLYNPQYCTCDRIMGVSGATAFQNGIEQIKVGSSNTTIYVNILNSKLSSIDVVGFKTWLQSNPINVQLVLKTPTIKTVDLSILDRDENTVTSISSFNDTTHVTTSSDTVPPIFEGYIATKESVE